jgi:hypothetical protein
MSDELDAATRAVAKRHGCDRAVFSVCWGEVEHGLVCRCKEDARAELEAREAGQ